MIATIAWVALAVFLVIIGFQASERLRDYDEDEDRKE